MELSGAEKRILALFHEMKFEDGRFTPSFARTWNSAQAEFDRAGPRRTLAVFLDRPGLLIAVLVISFLIAAVMLWPRHLRAGRQSQDSLAIQLPTHPGEATPWAEGMSVPRSPREAKPGQRNSNVAKARRLTRAKRTVAASTSRRVKESALSRWQSPTARLLRSHGDELLRNAPALIQPAAEMRIFLSNLN